MMVLYMAVVQVNVSFVPVYMKTMRLNLLLLAFTCSLQMNRGVACGAGSSYRYYFNAQAKECQTFLFNGCDGNSNNFANLEKCEAYCGVGGKSIYIALYTL